MSKEASDLAYPFRMLREEQLQRMQFLRHALDVIQPIDTHDHLDSSKPFLQARNPLLHRLFLQVLHT
jgi:hypothetical protein